MVRKKELTLVPNGNGVQLYLGPDLLDDSSCPFDQGDEVVAVAHHETDAIVLKPASDYTEYELVPKYEDQSSQLPEVNDGTL